MCCCDGPNINGTLGYKWQPNDKPGIAYPNAPTLQDGDTLLYDEPGRCGGGAERGQGLDSHSFHYRVVKRFSFIYLLVRHGGGEECISLYGTMEGVLAKLDSNGRYWVLNEIYHTHDRAKRDARETESAKWRIAAAEKRIKTRKLRGRNVSKVWIEDPVCKV